MWLLHKNYAITTKLSNPVSIVPKCPKDTSVPVPKCRDTSDMPKCPKSEVWKVRSVLGPKCPYTCAFTSRPTVPDAGDTLRRHFVMSVSSTQGNQFYTKHLCGLDNFVLYSDELIADQQV